MPERPDDYKGRTEELTVVELKYWEGLKPEKVEAEVTEESDDGQETWVLIVAGTCGLVGIIIIGVAFFYILRCCNKGRDGAKPHPGAIEPE